jgi:hypothetical protein
VLEKFDADFSAMAKAVQEGEFALWVGSGISRKAPSLGDLIENAFEYVRARAVEPATSANYLPALDEMLALAGIDTANVNMRFQEPLATWPERDTIINQLWNNYSRVLDVRIAGEAADFILWNAIDIRRAFENPSLPAAEHLCIAILVLEGAVKDIASANWDGFIESAVDKLSGGVPGIVQVVVDPGQLREPAGRARLLKFHGCIVHADREPEAFRNLLIGSRTQIMAWPESAEFRAMCNTVVNLATVRKTLVMGLSIQDNNLQTLFRRAKEAKAWPWPCAPEAPAYIFCEDQIQQGQRDVLRLAFEDTYNVNPVTVHNATLLRAWGEKVLIALVLDLVEHKLEKLMEIDLTSLGKLPIANQFRESLLSLRNEIADHAVPVDGLTDRTEFVNQAISVWSKLVSIFRSGSLPSDPSVYETLSAFTPSLIAADQNAQSMGLGRLGLALSLLHSGQEAGNWNLRNPTVDELSSGAISARSTRAGGADRPIFIVKSASEAISLTSNGAFANADDGAIVIHTDDTWKRMVGSNTRVDQSARRVRSAPGRTGQLEENHISLSSLLGLCDNKDSLEEEFLKEIML